MDPGACCNSKEEGAAAGQEQAWGLLGGSVQEEVQAVVRTGRSNCSTADAIAVAV